MKKVMSVIKLICPLLLVGILSCGGGNGGSGDDQTIPDTSNSNGIVNSAESGYQVSVPADLNDGLAVSAMSEQSIDEQAIAAMMDLIDADVYRGIDGIAIARNQVLVLEASLRQQLDPFDSWVDNQDLERHSMHSTSKSVVSALVGIALDKGYISNSEQLYYDLFTYPDYQNSDPRKWQMTLEDVLTMRLGLQWDEWSYPFGDARNSLTHLTENHQDWVKALLDLPMIAEPGEVYAYNTGATNSLALMLENVTGMAMEDFAQQELFQPLQIENAQWDLSPTGFPVGGSGLFLKLRDMVKFGLLFANGGEWHGQQIISESWVKRSLQESVDINWEYTNGYGYQWWLGEFESGSNRYLFQSTRGYGGQFIFIVPELDLVVAFTASNYENGLYELPFIIMENEILPALLSD